MIQTIPYVSNLTQTKKTKVYVQRGKRICMITAIIAILVTINADDYAVAK